MAWDYAYAIGTLNLDDVCTSVRIESEGGSSFLDPGIQVPGRDGVEFDSQAPFGPLDVVLRTILRYTDENGAVNHADGAPGHVFENLSLIKAAFQPELATLTRTIPHVGAVRALCKLTSRPLPEQRHVYLWPLTIPSGSWQDAAESSDTGNPPTAVTTTGDRVIFDPRISLSAAGTYTVTTADGTVYSMVASAGPTYPIVVDVGAGTVIDNAAADARGDVAFSHAHWFRLSPNHTHTVTSTAACTVFWRSRWA